MATADGGRWEAFPWPGEMQDFGVGKDTDDVGTPLHFLISRSSGLIDQIFFQRATGKL